MEKIKDELIALGYGDLECVFDIGKGPHAYSKHNDAMLTSGELNRLCPSVTGESLNFYYHDEGEIGLRIVVLFLYMNVTGI
jgi:hypothetical protein